jgi:DNA-binding LytR/AlgR family response regulator
MNYVIVDDEPLALEGLKRQLQEFDFLNLLATFSNSIKASSFLEANKVDLLFLDISMPNLSGIEMLNSLSHKPMVIFTTAHPKHAMEAFQLDALDYLIKPFSFEKLVKAVNKAKLMMKASIPVTRMEYIFIRSEGSFHRLYFNEIIHIEGMKDYVKVHSTKGMLTVAMNLHGIGEKLPKDVFIRVHKSFIVNKKKITQIDSMELMLDSVRIPVGGTYREALQNEVLSENMIKK